MFVLRQCNALLRETISTQKRIQRILCVSRDPGKFGRQFDKKTQNPPKVTAVRFASRSAEIKYGEKETSTLCLRLCRDIFAFIKYDIGIPRREWLPWHVSFAKPRTNF